MKTLLFLSVFSFGLHAEEFTKQIWSEGNHHYLMSYHQKTNLLISENCFNEGTPLEKSKCEAAHALNKKKTLKAPGNAFWGGKNPGAVVCQKLLGEKVAILKDPKNNENAFCRFADGSMISATNLAILLKD